MNFRTIVIFIKQFSKAFDMNESLNIGEAMENNDQE